MPDTCLDVVFTTIFSNIFYPKKACARTLDQALRCLERGGRLICMGPNIKFLPGSYWVFGDHHLALTEASLGEGLRLAGCEVDRTTDRSLPLQHVAGVRAATYSSASLPSVPIHMALFWQGNF